MIDLTSVLRKTGKGHGKYKTTQKVPYSMCKNGCIPEI